MVMRLRLVNARTGLWDPRDPDRCIRMYRRTSAMPAVSQTQVHPADTAVFQNAGCTQGNTDTGIFEMQTASAERTCVRPIPRICVCEYRGFPAKPNASALA